MLWLALCGTLLAAGDDKKANDIGLQNSADVRELVAPFTMAPKPGKSCRDLPRIINAGELQVTVDGQPAVISSWELAGVASFDESAQERVDALEAPPTSLVVLFDHFYIRSQFSVTSRQATGTVPQSGTNDERWRRAFESIREYLRTNFREGIDEIFFGVVRGSPRYYGKPTKHRADALENLAKLELEALAPDAEPTDPQLVRIDSTSSESQERTVGLTAKQWWERMHLMIQALEQVPGQKDIVFISSGSHASSGWTLELSRMGRLLGRSSAVLHTLDLRGTELRPGAIAPRGLDALADYGGGQAFANESANLTAATAALHAQAACRGALFVKPPAAKQSRPWNEVLVKYVGLDFTLHTPKQYATTEFAPRDTTDMALMALGHVEFGAKLDLELLLLDRTQRKYVWNGLVLLRLQTLDEPFGSYVPQLAVEVGAIQANGKKWILRRRIELGAAELKRDFAAPRVSQVFGYPVKVSPGKIEMLGSAINAPTGVKAFDREEQTVPIEAAGQLVVGSDVASIGGERVVLPRTNRRFTTGEPVRVFATRPGEEPQVPALLVDPQGRGVGIQLEREGKTPGGWSSYFVELNGLAEGSWKVGVGNSKAASEIEFTIAPPEQ